MSTSIRATAFAIVTLSLAFAASHAFAADTQTTSKMVKYGDLNLNTPTGVATLQHRVLVAARKACGPAEMIGSPDFASYSDCVQNAVKQAGERSAALIGSTRLAMN